MPRRWASIDAFEAFLDEGGIVEVDDAMPDPYRRAVFRAIELDANSKLIGALAEREWVPKTPGLRHKMAALAKTQDEVGHAHLLYMAAADLRLKSRAEMVEDLFAGRGRSQRVFHHPSKTWGDHVAIAFLVGAATLAGQQAVYKTCSYGPYKRALRRIIAEEESHAPLAEHRVRRMAEGTDKQRALFQRSIDDWWWRSLRLLGPVSDPGDALLRWYITSETGAALQDRFIQELVPTLASHGFTVPDPDLTYDDGRGRWVAGSIDWEQPEQDVVDVGSGSGRRVGDAAGSWQRTAWIRRAMERPRSDRVLVD